jgi:outer membrane usher protein
MRSRNAALALIILVAASLVWPAAASAAGPVELLLDTVINGLPTNTITTFVQFPDGSLGANLSDLSALGLKVEGRGPSNTLIHLSEVPTLTYRYDDRAQRISITIDSAYQRTRVLDVRPRDSLRTQPPRADWGALVNYDLFGAASNLIHTNEWSYSGASLTLDARLFSPFGVIEQTGIASVDAHGHEQTVRLNTTFSYSDPARLTTWTLGDTINGATTASRPIRIGGFQVQSNFALRPDLITTPLASLGGTAAVPSTVDLYVNNVRTYSQDVGSGPFNLINVPLVNGAGNAQVVIRNASGQTVTASLPFFSSASLLAPGLNSWSIEAGLPRTSFGASADTYESALAVSATWMRGASSWLTFGGHAEAGDGVVNGAADLTFKTGAIGVASATFAQSNYRGKAGSQVSLSYETSFKGINFAAGIQRTLGDYEDLASVTARLQPTTVTPSPLVYLSEYTGTVSDQASVSLYNSARAPVQSDHVTASGPLAFDRHSNWSISYVPTTLASGQSSRPLTASYFRTLPFNASFFATWFQDLAGSRSTGVFLGFNMALGHSSLSANVSTASGGATSTVQASRTLGLAPGDFGWTIRDSEGANPFHEVDAAARISPGTLRLGLQQSPAGASATLEATGAVAMMRNHVFFSDRIDDAFAVIDAGAPGVLITSENRPIGRTDRQGLLLAPTLRSYQNNSIEMDPSNLPVDVEIQSTRKIVTPAQHAGLVVSFAPKQNKASALIDFVDDLGGHIAAGSTVRVNGAGPFVLGYDGEAFVGNLRSANRAVIDLDNGECIANFDFRPLKGKQVRIGPVVCRRSTIATASPQSTDRPPGEDQLGIRTTQLE